eukprot:TRINITY_DN3167_c0_g1_i2.p1 TRINITY_DN3167_c0_g1~~TRINITY_DN3167_c0_g1_i2.p1  ORF type:complete len:590 (-),score=81.62 TRINITY_DN3167_c0_g1_i2:392-2161(-)
MEQALAACVTDLHYRIQRRSRLIKPIKLQFPKILDATSRHCCFMIEAERDISVGSAVPFSFNTAAQQLYSQVTVENTTDIVWATQKKTYINAPVVEGDFSPTLCMFAYCYVSNSDTAVLISAHLIPVNLREKKGEGKQPELASKYRFLPSQLHPDLLRAIIRMCQFNDSTQLFGEGFLRALCQYLHSGHPDTAKYLDDGKVVQPLLFAHPTSEIRSPTSTQSLVTTGSMPSIETGTGSEMETDEAHLDRMSSQSSLIDGVDASLVNSDGEDELMLPQLEDIPQALLSPLGGTTVGRQKRRAEPVGPADPDTNTTTPAAVSMPHFFTCGKLVAPVRIVETGGMGDMLRPTTGFIDCPVRVRKLQYNIESRLDGEAVQKAMTVNRPTLRLELEHLAGFYHEEYEKCKLLESTPGQTTFFNNPMVALRSVSHLRKGDNEDHALHLRYDVTSYIHHRCMRAIWLKLSEDWKTWFVRNNDFSFSTSFGLHLAVITNDQPPCIAFVQRSNSVASATGKWQSGFVEGAQLKDVTRPSKEHPENSSVPDGIYDPYATARRGLAEELGLNLNDAEFRKVLNLSIFYQKTDTCEVRHYC